MPTNAKEYMIAGGVAGVVSRTAIAPIERLKILYQLGATSENLPFTRMASNILKDEGPLAFWKGNTAAVVRVVPYMSITFCTYEEYKARLGALSWPKNLVSLSAGSLAGLTAVAATYPLDLVRATMAQQGHVYSSVFDALTRISRERGVLALYAGIGATSLGVAPYAGLKFACYETMKVAFSDVLAIEESQLRPWQRVSAGALAGLIAQTFVYPFDVVRRRMQTGRVSSSGHPYTGVVNALSTICREEGFRGLYRGLSLNYLKTMPNVAIYMSLYDVVKYKLMVLSR